jgi:hypothetical protein
MMGIKSLEISKCTDTEVDVTSAVTVVSEIGENKSYELWLSALSL